MKRALVMGLLVAGCGNAAKLAEVEKQLAAATAEEAALQRDVATASVAVGDAERALEGERARLTSATRTLTNQQPNVVRRWAGDAKKLAALKKQHTMPKALLTALDTAQAAGKDGTPERKFEIGLNAEKLTEAGAVLDGWEAAEFSYEAPEEKPADDCKPAEVPTLTCRPDKEHAVLLCDGPENTWLLWSERGELFARSAPLAGLTVKERPAPGVWVLAKGSEGNLYETSESDPNLRWVAALPAKAHPVWSNLDIDPYPELVLELEGGVRIFDVESAHGVKAIDELESCRRLNAAGTLPAAAKPGCTAREVGADAGR